MVRDLIGISVFSGFLKALFIVLMLTSCGSDDSYTYNEYERSIQLMDEGHYNEAIYLMEQKLSQNDKDLRARKLLAAAYAGRAGIHLKQYIDLSEMVVESFREEPIETKQGVFNLAKNLQIKATTAEAKEANKLLKQFSQWLVAIRNLEDIITALNKVPKIGDAIQANDIKLAVSTLAGKNKHQRLVLPPEMSLYRALLRLTVLNYDLRYTYDWSNPTNCSVKMTDLIEQAEEIYSEISLVLLDVADSSISSNTKESVLKVANRIQSSFKNFSENSTSLETQLTIALVDGELKSQKGCK